MKELKSWGIRWRRRRRRNERMLNRKILKLFTCHRYVVNVSFRSVNRSLSPILIRSNLLWCREKSRRKNWWLAEKNLQAILKIVCENDYFLVFQPIFEAERERNREMIKQTLIEIGVDQIMKDREIWIQGQRDM